jgi:MFS superfamily sulfate permease-like transporter
MTTLHLKNFISIKETHIMKQLVLFLLLMQAGHASTYTLSKVLKSAAQQNSLFKALQQESLALEAKNKANTASDPLELFGEGTKAYPHAGGSGNEYAVGLSKKFIFGNIQEQEQKITRLSNQAYLLDEERNILNFKNGLKNIYHQHCLDGQNYRSFEQSYQEFVKLYNKKQKAYKYQEISKTELMQLEIEKNSLYAQLQEIKMQQNISKQNLFMLSKIHYTTSTKLSCKDMYPIKSNVKLGNTFQLSKEAYDKRVQSTHEALDRYSNSIDSVSLSAQYTEELDVDKYTVGLSIPLNFTSARSEEARAAAMYQNSAISFKHEQTMTEKKSLLAQLRSQLKGKALMVKTLKHNYQNYQKNLLPLIKKSYDLGEISVIEYLLNRQRSYQLRQEIYATKKAYYNTLFKLYTISEKKDN